MTTGTAAVKHTTVTAGRPRRSLEKLVDRLFAAMGLGADTEMGDPTATRSIHEARRLRQAGDIDGALAVLAGVDVAKATPREVRWAFSEWRDLVMRRFGNCDALVYTQGAGRAAVFVPGGVGLLEVAAVLGMRWPPGRVVPERSLRGLRSLGKACHRLAPGAGVPRS